MSLAHRNSDLASAAGFSIEDLRARAEAKLSLAVPSPSAGGRGDDSPGTHQRAGTAVLRPAAVLIPIVARAEGPTILLTQRASALSRHAGQIAFPGGRIETSDSTPLAAALREAEEEIGLTRETVTPLGYLDPYFTGSGYRILPVVGIVTPPFALLVNPDEVQDAFEVPAQFLMDPANHLWHLRERDGQTRGHYAMPFGERYIWGATAGILRNLYDRLYA
jgi:8-oxo-dGTP pyrophosphatase MutT (NUDIX family)